MESFSIAECRMQRQSIRSKLVPNEQRHGALPTESPLNGLRSKHRLLGMVLMSLKPPARTAGLKGPGDPGACLYM